MGNGQLYITAKSIREALDVKPHQLRRWLEALPPYVNQHTEERSARRFTAGDLIFLALVQELETRYGLTLSAISRFSRSLYTVVHGPKRYQRFIFLELENNACHPIEEMPPASAGFVLDLEPAHIRVANVFSIPTSQSELFLGLTEVRSQGVQQ